MKKLFTLLFVVFSIFANAQTTLTNGDIVIVNMNCDDPDQLQWIPLVDLAIGTNIKFTDCGWTAAGTFRSGEYCLQWTNSTLVSKGTLITFNLTTYPGTASTGNLAIYNGAVIISNGSGYSASNDQVISFQGTDAAPTLIFAVYSKGAAGTAQTWDADGTSTNNSANPGCSGVVVGGDNIVYNLDVSGTKASIIASITNATNWTGNDATRQNYTGLIVLPVSISSFTGSYTNNTSLLKWSVGNEININKYAVEHSIDGKTFSEIGFVNATGSNDYSYIDVNTKATINFYRLRIVGVNETKYSAVVKILSDAFGSKLNVYPSPAVNTVNAEFTSQQKTTANVQLIDAGGKIVLQKNTQIQQGYNNLNFDINTLNKGTYILKMTIGTNAMSAVFNKF